MCNIPNNNNKLHSESDFTVVKYPAVKMAATETITIASRLPVSHPIKYFKMNINIRHKIR